MQTEQEVQASLEVQEGLQKMMREVKVRLKGESKNELIRIVGALLLDNYALKMQLAELQPKPESKENEK